MFWFSPRASMQVKGMGGLSNGRQLVTVFQMCACAPLGAKEGSETQVLTWPLKASQKDMYPTETYAKWFTLLYFFQNKPAQMSFLVWRLWRCILFSISRCVFCVLRPACFNALYAIMQLGDWKWIYRSLELLFLLSESPVYNLFKTSILSC